MSAQIRRASVTASGLGPTSVIPFGSGGIQAYDSVRTAMLPIILTTISAGATLTYDVEVTGDDINAPGYSPASGNWNVIAELAGKTTSESSTLLGPVTGLRLNVTAWTDGSVTMAFIAP